MILLLFFLLLNGCSLNNPFLEDEVDTVTVVKYTPYMKHHRAYFSRGQLKTLSNGKKYLYLYHAKTNEIAVLLHRKNQYVLYNMSKPKQQPYTMNVTSKTKYWQVLKGFERKGFKIIKSLASVGYTASVSRKKYKGLKTILIETQEYSRLQTLYKKAIKTYNASKIKNIKTRLPKSLISSYYDQYKKRAKTRVQLVQLSTIAKKLKLQAPKVPEKALKKQKITPSKQKKHIAHKDKPSTQIEEKVEEKTEVLSKPTVVQEKPSTKPIVKKVSPSKPSAKPYTYYLKHASLSELSTYISNKATKNSLSYNQYNMLSRRKVVLQEERLFEHGSLEELIAAYKVNKNPKYKQRIMKLMKDKQAHH
jgi:hypothetical protein